MRRRFCFLIALVALALGARPQAAVACSILPVPPDRQARVVQDTIDQAELIARGTVVDARPAALNGRYYQQLTLDIATTWRGTSATQVTIIGASLSSDTSLASTIGVFTGNAPMPPCGSSPRAVGDDLLVFAQSDRAGHAGRATIAAPNDPLAAALRAQLGAGAAPPPASPAFRPFLPLLLGAVAGVAGLGLVVRRCRSMRRPRRG